jgi:acyl-coenzyme A thioesterase PaaI-like protein
MRFFEDGNDIVSHWDPQEHFQGYNHVLHGGIQATLMDELASWVVFVKLKTAGVTQSMEIDYRKPSFTNGGRVVLRAAVESREKRRASIRCRLYQNDVASSEALCVYALYPERMARERLHYPGVEAFYREDA